MDRGDVLLALGRRFLGFGQLWVDWIRTWEFICECYVDGMVDGKFFQEHCEPTMKTFVLD